MKKIKTVTTKNTLSESRILHFIILFLFTALTVWFSVGNIYAAGRTPAKLSAEDFIFTVKGGEKRDFFEESKNEFAYWFCLSTSTDVKEKDQATYSTNRGVKLKSTEDYVKKQYGSTTKRKVDQKEKYYKYTKYNNILTDLSLWKNYLEYSYRKKGDSYKIRFYLNAKNKVSAIAYIKNLDQFYNYPNKEIDPGLVFKAPKGKAISTKKINGKKVYMLPKGTKIRFNKPIKSTIWLELYNPYGKLMAGVPGYGFGDGLKHKKDYDLEGQINQKLMSGKDYTRRFNTKKLGKYLYFILRVMPPYGSDTTAPAYYYFKFK